MTDRELLILSAKAAGIVGEYESWTYQGFNEGIRQVLNGIKCWKPWNPLTDDGDALRLAVKFLFEIDMGRGCIAIGHSTGIKILEAFNHDPLAATRRAIVRAAAELGRSLA